MRDLTKGTPIKIIIYFTIPLLIGNIFQQFYSMADTLIVGRTISVNALAAVGSTSSLMFLIIGFAQGMTAGLAIVTAQRYGAQDYRGVKRSFAMSILISLMMAVILTILSVIFVRPILELMQTPASIMNDAVTFVTIIFLGIPASFAFNLLSNMLRALGDSRTPLFFLIFASVVNVGLDLFFILYFKMGVEGAGIATVTAQLLSSVLCVIYIYRKIPALVLRKKDFKLDQQEFHDHIRLALPMGFQASIIAIGALVLQTTLNTLGPVAVAANTAAAKIDQLAVQPMMSFGITMATYAAQNIGAKEYGRVSKGVRQALLVSVGFALLVGGLIILNGRFLVNLFVGNGVPQVTEMAQIYFRIASSCYFILAILFIVRYTLQGLGQSMIPTFAGIAELVMRTFAAIVLVKLLGFAGAAMANPLAWLGSTLVLLSSYFKTMRRLKLQEAAQTKEMAEKDVVDN